MGYITHAMLFFRSGPGSSIDTLFSTSRVAIEANRTAVPYVFKSKKVMQGRIAPEDRWMVINPQKGARRLVRWTVHLQPPA
jgi:hypothetical protein